MMTQFYTNEVISHVCLNRQEDSPPNDFITKKFYLPSQKMRRVGYLASNLRGKNHYAKYMSMILISYIKNIGIKRKIKAEKR